MASKRNAQKPNTKSFSHSDFADDEWDIVPTGFAPIWKPEKDGDAVVFKPRAITKIEAKKGKNSKDSYLIVGVYVSGSKEFYQKDNVIKVNAGEDVALGGATLMSSLDEKKLMFYDSDKMDEPRISKLTEKLVSLDAPCMVVYKGKQKSATKGHAPMKVFELRVPKGVLAQI